MRMIWRAVAVLVMLSGLWISVARADTDADLCHAPPKSMDEASAVDACNRALDANPAEEKRAGLLLDRGLLFANSQAFKNALFDLDATIALKPGNPGAYQVRGFVLLKMGDLRRAVADFTEALRLDP